MGPSALALATFKIAVGRRRATLAGLKFIWIHGQAHTATGLAPIKTGFLEHSIKPFLFCLLFHLSAAGHNHRTDMIRNFVPCGDLGSRIDGERPQNVTAGESAIIISEGIEAIGLPVIETYVILQPSAAAKSMNHKEHQD